MEYINNYIISFIYYVYILNYLYTTPQQFKRETKRIGEGYWMKVY